MNEFDLSLRTSSVNLSNSGIKKSDLILPIFLANQNSYYEIPTMPGLRKIPLSKINYEVKEVLKLGISSIILFGSPKTEDLHGMSALAEDNVVQKATYTLKKEFGDSITIIADICVCQYNYSGHCGIVDNYNIVNNDLTLSLLAKISLSYAKSGVDFVAPSSMMDGQVKAIRYFLNENGFKNIKILSFSAKHASSLYTPFRSANYALRKTIIDKSGYQSSYHNTNESIREIDLDIKEGADIVMIKPALFYLDLIYCIKQNFTTPLAVQNVSGEYSMMMAASMDKRIDLMRLVAYTILSIKRAGADMVISYFAKEIASLL